MIDITVLHDKQMRLLQTYLLKEEATSPLHAAVAKQTIDTHRWIYLLQMKINSPQTKNKIKKLKDSGPKKPYKADTRMTSANST